MKKQLTIFLVLFLMFAATAQVQVTSGKVQRFENFKSKRKKKESFGDFVVREGIV